MSTNNIVAFYCNQVKKNFTASIFLLSFIKNSKKQFQSGQKTCAFLTKRKKIQKTLAIYKRICYNIQARNKAHWSSGQDASLSRWKLGFDSRMGHQRTKHLEWGAFFVLWWPIRHRPRPKRRAFWIRVRILRARRWELVHKSREQKYSPQAKFPEWRHEAPRMRCFFRSLVTHPSSTPHKTQSVFGWGFAYPARRSGSLLTRRRVRVYSRRVRNSRNEGTKHLEWGAFFVLCCPIHYFSWFCFLFVLY